MTDELQKIEAALRIKFEEHQSKSEKEQTNIYKYYRGEISTLVFKDVVIEDLDVLLPFFKKLYNLSFINCTIGNITSLRHFERLYELKLDNVQIRNIEQLSANTDDAVPTIGRNLHVNLKNMHIEHLSAFLPIANIDHLFITNCTICHFYEVNLLPKLYDLRLDEVIIQQSEQDVIHKPIEDRYFIRLCIRNMELKDLDVFLPIGEKMSNIDIRYSTIDNIRAIHRFPKLALLDIDSSTVIKDREIPTDKVADFFIEQCECMVIEDEEAEEAGFFDLQNLRSIAHYIQKLKFCEQTRINPDFLAHFSQLEHLEFKNCHVPLGDFLAVAPQIKTLLLDNALLQQTEAFAYFTQLEQIEIYTHYEGKCLEDFEKLLPLKHQLKKLDMGEDDVKNIELIKEFAALKSLRISVTSAEAARSVLSLQALQKLHLFIDIEEPQEPILFDLRALKNIRALSLTGDYIDFEGIESLSTLERLELYCDCRMDAAMSKLQKLKHLSMDNSIDVNKMPRMDALQVLELDVNEDYELHSLAHFPNLERLKIQATSKIKLGKLEKLKVLVVQWIDLENTEIFEHLPNLEELDISCCEISVVKNLDKLSHLKVLNLEENYKIKNIDGLENLKNLEKLNLYDNQVSDIRVLNKLPNLKEVNLENNEIDEEEVAKQLDKPEIAYFMSRPYAPFRIWKSDYFEV